MENEPMSPAAFGKMEAVLGLCPGNSASLEPWAALEEKKAW